MDSHNQLDSRVPETPSLVVISQGTDWQWALSSSLAYPLVSMPLVSWKSRVIRPRFTFYFCTSVGSPPVYIAPLADNMFLADRFVANRFVANRFVANMLCGGAFVAQNRGVERA